MTDLSDADYTISHQAAYDSIQHLLVALGPVASNDVMDHLRGLKKYMQGVLGF